MSSSEQLADIDAWRGQVDDMAAEIRARYPRWLLAQRIFNDLKLLSTELIRLRGAVVLNDPMLAKEKALQRARERARQNLAESEELTRRMVERMSRA
ncbi:MAG: hypothetical protein PT944_06510 [Actinomycetaceae bacterium]|nr:hypothetical protein [Actinomycetaceae bacterium]MDY5273021.1 hypothetical protein [Arcanobacterium sp.]